MKWVEQQSAVDWCSDRDLVVDARRSVRPSWAATDCLRVPTSAEGPRLLSLGYLVLMAHVHDSEREIFKGGLVWITLTDVWSPQTEQVGHALRDALMFRGTGDTARGRARAVLLGADEFIEAQALLALAMIFQWNALFVPVNGAHFAWISHDGYLAFGARQEEQRNEFCDRLKRAGWEPTLGRCSELL